MSLAHSPTSCPILLFDPPTTASVESDDLQSLIKDAYREVSIYRKSARFLSRLKLLRSKQTLALSPPVIVLVNIDQNDGTDLHGLDLFRTIVRELGGPDFLESDTSFILVAISNDSSPLVLCQCMDLGAENVLVRPVRKEVVQTLWLNAVRRVTRSSSPHRIATPVPIAMGSIIPHVRCHPKIMKGRTQLDFITSNLSAMHANTDHISSLYLYDSSKESPSPDHEVKHSGHSLQFTQSVEQISDQRKLLAKKINSWNFDPRRLDGEMEVMRSVAMMLENVAEECGGLTATGVGVDRGVLHKFILSVQSSYHDCNPYHNFYHAVDVLQATYTYLTKMKVIGGGPSRGGSTTENTQIRQPKILLRPHEKFALCIAALCHDLGHPGVNNMFMVNCGSPLAEVYNDVAVLENYHAAALFALLRRDDVSFFGGRNKDELFKTPRYKDFRRIVTSAILATDMGRHIDYVKRITERGSEFRFPIAATTDTTTDAADGSSSVSPSPPELEDDDRTLFAAVLLKCADISNAARPFPVALEWSTALLEEFDMQRRVENGISADAGGNPMMANQPIGQIMFIDKFVGPLLDAVVGKQAEHFVDDSDTVEMTEWPDIAEDVPTTGLLELEFCRKMLHRNRREWERRMANPDDVRIAEDACAGSHADSFAEEENSENMDVDEISETNSVNRLLIPTGTSMSSTICSNRRSSLPTIPICLRPATKDVIHSSPTSPSITKLSSPVSRHSHHHTHSHHTHTVPSFFPHTENFHNPPVSPAMSRTAPMNAIVMGPFKSVRHNMTTNIGPGAVRYAYGTRSSGCGFSSGMADKFGIRGFSENGGGGAGGGRRGSLPNYTSTSSMEFANAFATLKFQTVPLVPQYAVRDEISFDISASSKLLRSYLPTAISGTNPAGGPHSSFDSKIPMPIESDMSREHLLAPNNSEFNRGRRKSIPPDWPL